MAVHDDELAALLADASGHLGPAPGAALLSDGRLRVSSRPGGTTLATAVREPAGLVPATRDACALAGGHLPATAELALDFDLDAPVTEPIAARPGSSIGDPTRLPEPEASVAVLAGPGVIRGNQLDHVRSYAAAAGLGVANTWGAKGMFAWDSPHHLGTCGLQAHDFDLLGFAEVDLLVATGVDPDEAAEHRWALAPHAVVPPEHLAALAVKWAGATPAGPPNRLYPGLAAVVQRLSPSAHVPLSPARAVVDLRAVLPVGGVIAADAGLAGFWVARTFPTTDARSIGVPATVAPGYAAAAALSARLGGRQAIAVATAPLDEMTARVIELAEALDVGLTVELWAREGRLARADDHAAEVSAALEAGRATVLTVPVDPTHTDELVAVAGDVVAWGGLLLSGGR